MKKMHKQQQTAEQHILTEPGTPPNQPILQQHTTLFRNQAIKKIINSNQQLINSLMKTIKELQLSNYEKQQRLKTIQNKYQTMLQFTENSSSTENRTQLGAGTAEEKLNNKCGNTTIDISSMVQTILSLEKTLSITKVQLAIKSAQLLTQDFNQKSTKSSQIKKREIQTTNLPVQTLFKIFENSSNQKISSNMQGKDNLNGEKKQLIEAWSKILQNYGNSEYKLHKLKEKSIGLIKKFIPKQIRKDIWPQLVENKLGMTNSLYIQLLERRQKGWVCQKVKSQIEKDIKRSFYGKTNYQTKTSIIFQVVELLQIFHIYRPDVSYVQGMTYPAIILIPILGKIKAFNVFCNIILGNSFFRKLFSMQSNFISLICRGFQNILEEYLPQLSKKFKQMSIQSQIYLIQWLFTFFSRGLSIETTHKFWDLFLYYQEVAMFRMILSIFQQIEEVILDLNFQEVINFIRQYGLHINEQKLLQRLVNNKFSSEKLYKYFQKVKI